MKSPKCPVTSSSSTPVPSKEKAPQLSVAERELYGLGVRPPGDRLIQSLLIRIHLLKQEVQRAKSRTKVTSFEFDTRQSKRSAKSSDKSQIERTLTKLEIEETVMLELRDKLKKRLESPRKDRHDLQEKHKRLQAQIDNNRDCMRREADRRIELEEVNQRLQGEVEGMTLQDEKDRIKEKLDQAMMAAEYQLLVEDMKTKDKILKELKDERDKNKGNQQSKIKHIHMDNMKLEEELRAKNEELDKKKFKLEELQQLSKLYTQQTQRTKAQVKEITKQLDDIEFKMDEPNHLYGQYAQVITLDSQGTPIPCQPTLTQLKSKIQQNNQILQQVRSQYSQAKLCDFQLRLKLSKLYALKADLQITYNKLLQSNQTISNHHQSLLQRDRFQKHHRQHSRQQHLLLKRQIERLQEEYHKLRVENEYVRAMLVNDLEVQDSRMEELVGILETGAQMDDVVQDFVEKWVEIRGSYSR